MINLGFGASTREPTPLLAAGFASLLSLFGCAAEDSSEILEGLAQTGSAEGPGQRVPENTVGHDDPDTEGEWEGDWPDGTTGGTLVDAPEGSYIAQVKANGTGCKLGTSKVTIAKDGQTFEIEFPDYQIDLTPKSKLVTRDCTISVALVSPGRYSFAVNKLLYSGDVRIDSGVQMRIASRYWFQGDATGTLETERKNNIDGPYKQDYLYAYTPDADTLLWSPCGKQRLLHVYTRLQLMNGTPARSGSASLASAIDGTSRLAFGLTWRKCGADE